MSGQVTVVVLGVGIPITVAVIGLLGKWLLTAIKRSARALIEEVVDPKFTALHKRIDEHMTEEESDRRLLVEAITSLPGGNADELRGRIERLRDADHAAYPQHHNTSGNAA